MKRVTGLYAWLIFAALTLSGIAFLGQLLAADAPWYVDNIVKTSSDALNAEATTDGNYLQLELKVAPSVTNVPWHNFKIVDVRGEEVGELSSRNEDKGILIFEGDWSKVVGLYLEGMNHKQELFPNAVVEDIPKTPVVEQPVTPVVERPVVNTVVDRPVVRTEEVRYVEPDRRVVVRDTDRVVRHDTVRHVYDNDRHTTVIHHDGHDDHVIHDGHDHVDEVVHDDDHTVHVEGCTCGHCDGHGHAHGGSGHGHGGNGSGSGSGSGTGCALCGGVGCAECGGAGNPWEIDSFAKKCGQGDSLAMGSDKGHSFAADSAFGEGKGTGAGPSSGMGPGKGEGTGEGSGPGEGAGPGPGEGTGPGPGEGVGPGPGEGEGPCPDEGEGPDPGEKPANAPGTGPGPGPGDADCDCDDYGPEPPEMNPMNPNFKNGNGPGAGSNMIGPNYKNMAPRIRPRVHNLAKNFLPDPPVIDGPEMYVFNPQVPYWNPQMPYFQPGFGYGYGGGGGGGYGYGGGGYGYLPEDAVEAIAPPKMEEGMVLYISTGGPNTEGKIYQVNEHGRVLGMVNLPYTATGMAMHKDNGLVCVSPRDGGKVYRIDDSAKVTTVLENDENVVHPTDVAMGYNSDAMVLADNLAKTLSLSNVAGMKPVTDRKLAGGKYDQPEISVAMGRDKSVVFSTSEEDGIFRYTGSAKPSKVLEKKGAVAASTGSMLWAAMQGDKDIVVMEGDQPQRTFSIPEKNAYHGGLMSFGPRESVVVAAKDPTGENDKPWLIQFSVDDQGQEQIRNLFQWDNAARGEMVDFVVGPRMYWERNNHKTMKSVY